MAKTGSTVAVLLALLLLTGMSAADGPAMLMIDGRPAPVNLLALEQDGVVYVSAGAMVMLGRIVLWGAEDRTSADINVGYAAFRLSSGQWQARRLKRDGSEGAGQTLEAAPVMHEGALMLPLSAVQDVLDASAAWDADARIVRLGTIPTQAKANVRKWCGLLRIQRVPLFQRGGISLKLGVPQGTELPPDQEFLLTWEADTSVSLQIYEIYDNQAPNPLFGRAADGSVKHPFGDTVPVHWGTADAGVVGRWPLSTSEVGSVTYVAIATDAQDPPPRLLDALRGDRAAEGNWAIAALTVDVVEPDDEG